MRDKGHQVDLEIAVINYNTKNYLKRSLESFDGYPITVIDNGSTDGSQQMVKKDFQKANLVVNKDNKGYSKAANQALLNTSAKYLFLLNSDTVLVEGKLLALTDFMDKQPDAGLVGPMLINEDGSVQLSGRNFPSFTDAFMHSFLGVLFPNNKYSRRYKMADWDRLSLKEVDWVSGAAMMINVEAARAVGLFDEDYFMYVEDMDFCYSLNKAGYKVFLMPQVKLLHHWGKSSSKQSTKMIIEFQKSIYRFFSKQNKNSIKRFLKPLVIVGLVIRALLLIILTKLKR
ncbi:MAG: glycosyltransferase family 2 protein [Actinobacteria bacterium]|nr:MAG: glycosyltransferase family 2 protein [Actinomycetota bacterium]